MKYLSISPTVMVRMESIDAVELSEDNLVKVYIGDKSFDSLIPMATFIGLLNSKDSNEESMASDLRQLRENSQYFGG